ncbi:MAG TPA: peptide chain release factor N(5)-glutamine methyltransferase [bacterium]
MKAGELLSSGINILKSGGVAEPVLNAEILLSQSMGTDRTGVYTRIDDEMPLERSKDFLKLLERKLEFEPVQYIRGYAEFYGRRFIVSKDVLIPRPETELLVEEVIDFCSSMKHPKILDLCTGSGNIAVTLKKEIPGSVVFASDISSSAINIAVSNAKENGIGDGLHFFCADLFSGLHIKKEFDVIVSNPPYIPSAKICSLQFEVSGYEPKIALDGGKDGLDAIKRIIRDAYNYLIEGRMLLLEIDPEQQHAISDIIKMFRMYTGAAFLKDLSGDVRAFRAVKKKSVCNDK